MTSFGKPSREGHVSRSRDVKRHATTTRNAKQHVATKREQQKHALLRVATHQHFKASAFQESDLVGDSEIGETWNRFGEFNDLDNRLCRQLGKFFPQTTICFFLASSSFISGNRGGSRSGSGGIFWLQKNIICLNAESKRKVLFVD